TVPAGVVRPVVELSGGTHGNNNNNNNNQGDGANLYVRRGGEPTSSNYDCRSRDGGNEDTCTINHPDSGTWYATTARDPDYGNNDGYRNVRMSVTWLVSENVEGVSGAGCESGSSGTGWRNCTFATPDIPGTDRSEAQEITNFATWFSYFRTRMKTAKAG